MAVQGRIQQGGSCRLETGRKERSRMVLPTDIAVKSVRLDFASQPFRSPLKFGSAVIESLTLLTATVEIENQRGSAATGVGNVLLSFPWAFPEGAATPEERDRTMRRVAELYANQIQQFNHHSHPIDLFAAAQDDLFKAASEIDAEMPRLAALVAASPIDCAVHDAFGRANQICSYEGYGREHCGHDLSRFFGKEYAQRYIADSVRDQYALSLPVFHLVGGLDPLRRSELSDRLHHDCRPVTLEEWIQKEGVYCFKLKLRGNDLDWDLNRCREVTDVAREGRRSMGSDQFHLSIDTNEICDSPEYCIELLDRLKSDDPEAFNAILYLEQPTGRDLRIHDHDMRPLASMKPVLVDESTSSLSDFEQAIELGWSGIALKTCKCLSLSLLEFAKAKHEGLLYSVQDLTNCGCGLVHSVGFAARIDPILGVECNSRQFIPAANDAIRSLHRDIVEPRNGTLRTQSLEPVGLGCRFGP
jgi:L-alanine-DL-glutamate epimerase-like enolase superfamily enzyme